MTRCDLFGPVPTKSRRVLMRVVDAGHLPDGKAGARFVCNRCGHDTGWIYAAPKVARAGLPCDTCNAVRPVASPTNTDRFQNDE